MWNQKKTHHKNGGENGMDFKKAVPKLRGTGDIDMLLNQSNSNDKLEQEAQTKKPDGRSGCGCGW